MLDDETDQTELTAADAVDVEDAALWAEFEAADNDKTIDAGKPDDAGDAGADFPDGDGDGDAGQPTGDADGADAPAQAPSSLWDTASPELRAEYDALTARTAKLEQQARSATGRATGFQRRYEELLKAAEPRQAEAGNRVEIDAALATLQEDYPEIAQPLQKALGAIEGNVKQLSAAEEGRREAAQAELNDYVQAETSQVLAQHPDYLTVLGQNAEELAAWIDDQPRRMREAFLRNSDHIVSAAEAAEIVSAFKAHLAMPADAPADQSRNIPSSLSARRERQLASTASPTNRHRRPTVSGIPENGDPQAIWDAFEVADKR